MTVQIRLYAKTDPDLIALDSCDEFSLGGWMKKAVRAYVRGEKLCIPIPETPDEPAVMEDRRIYFMLSEKSDGDVIRMMKAIRPRLRNTAIKLLIRAYLEKPFLLPLFSESSHPVRSLRMPKQKQAKTLLIFSMP